MSVTSRNALAVTASIRSEPKLLPSGYVSYVKAALHAQNVPFVNLAKYVADFKQVKVHRALMIVPMVSCATIAFSTSGAWRHTSEFAQASPGRAFLKDDPIQCGFRCGYLRRASTGHNFPSRRVNFLGVTLGMREEGNVFGPCHPVFEIPESWHGGKEARPLLLYFQEEAVRIAGRCRTRRE